MTGTGKSITVKDWFANKLANEIGRNISRCDLFGIIKESEKAVYALADLGSTSKATWIPKSVLIEREVGETESGSYNYETFRFENYDTAKEEFNRFKAQFN